MYYEENANLGNYESARIGVNLKSDKALQKGAEIKEESDKLLELAKAIVKEKLQVIKDEKGAA